MLIAYEKKKIALLNYFIYKLKHTAMFSCSWELAAVDMKCEVYEISINRAWTY